jgi:hypothetical protein
MFTYSLEDEYLNIKNAISDRGILYLYSQVPLFISRISPSLPQSENLTDTLDNDFISILQNELYYLVSKKPFCIFNRKDKLSSEGIKNFCIDLSFISPDQVHLNSILKGYKENTRSPNSEFFNFKAGLK